MCKNKEQCPNKDKCKCVVDYTKVEGIPMTTSPHHRLNREDGCDTIEDNEEHFPINMVGVFEDEEDL